MTTKVSTELSVEEKLIATIKARIIELRTILKNTRNPIDRASLQGAIANNCGWLLNLGQSLTDMPELEEV